MTIQSEAEIRPADKGPTTSGHESRIGFMQGRLSPLVDGRIQAFPAQHWRDEIRLAGDLEFRRMEWTLDHDGLHENPLLTPGGRTEIEKLAGEQDLLIRSVTGDFFMQAPFFKFDGSERRARLDDLQRVIDACLAMGITCLVVPLVDNGSPDGPRERDLVSETLTGLMAQRRDEPFRLLFESDLPLDQLRAFMDRFPDRGFGVNLDIGNSVALGFTPAEEIATLGPLIHNVHVKDRLLGGTTVPLGQGAADFPAVFDALRRMGYGGQLILQTARAADGDHVGALVGYRDQVRTWLADAA